MIFLQECQYFCDWFRNHDGGDFCAYTTELNKDTIIYREVPNWCPRLIEGEIEHPWRNQT